MFFRAGKPPVGLHLDVLKNDKLIQVREIYATLKDHVLYEKILTPCMQLMP